MSVTLDDLANQAKPTPPSTALRGPANADNFRQKVGRYSDRFYIDPLPTCPIAEADAEWIGPSVSVVKKAAGFGAAEYVVMDRMSQSDELATIAALPQEKRYGRLKNLNDEGRNEAFARGHGVHLAAEQILYGYPVTVREGEPGWEYLPALQAFFDTCQPTLVAAEVVCLHRDLNSKGYGGTTDAIVGIDGGIYDIDYKSRGKDHGAYPEEAAQIAAYLKAQYMLVEGEHGAERRRLPDVTGGLIISITRDSFEVHPIDVDKAFDHWTSLHAWWLARQEERSTILRKWAPRKVAAPISPGEQPSIRSGVSSLSPGPVDEPNWRFEAKRRYDLLNDTQRAEYTKRKAGIDTGDPAAVFALLDEVEPFNLVATPPLTDAEWLPFAAALGITPDEGGTVAAPTIAALRQAFEALPDAAQLWISTLTAEGETAGVDWRTGAMPSLRRYELGRAVIRLAGLLEGL